MSSTKFVIRADQKTKIATLADSSKRWHIVLRCTICGPLDLLFYRKGQAFNSHVSKIPNTTSNNASFTLRCQGSPTQKQFCTVIISVP